MCWPAVSRSGCGARLFAEVLTGCGPMPSPAQRLAVPPDHQPLIVESTGRPVEEAVAGPAEHPYPWSFAVRHVQRVVVHDGVLEVLDPLSADSFAVNGEATAWNRRHGDACFARTAFRVPRRGHDRARQADQSGFAWWSLHQAQPLQRRSCVSAQQRPATCCPVSDRSAVATAFSAAQLERNSARDAETDTLLLEHGWLPIHVWEHEAPRKAAARVREQVMLRVRTGL